ncbi:anti-sigma regulatory factor [Metasolibacillus sp. FSL H7-0170]|uniref:anti-sigma regulatory factor n=1 Tax=Metasolibacillus TaxID=2703677 RepID=UPI0007962639|nr:anti-sigma regulatory factor [Metasolibacillus fluoroglycofenilyticus]KYG89616.1 serine/threonine protein kinase [[Bacillus] sp. KCTC 13219]
MKSTVNITTEWDIVTAREIGRNEAKRIGFDTVNQARITTVISELARNIYLYASVGTITIEKIEEDGKIGLAITATDQGPGIEDVRTVMQDGFSTSGSIGAGLPGVKRLMDDIEIQSQLEEGTTVRVKKWL